MSPLTPPVPVVLVGIHTEIGLAVAEGLKPEWDANYTHPARAVLFGRGFAQRDAETLRHEFYISSYDKNAVLWVAADAASVARIRAERKAAKVKEEGKEEEEERAEGGVEEEEEEEEEGGGGGGVAGTPPPNAAEIIVPLFRRALEGWRDRGAEKGGLVLY
ncbi:hypothetical protein F5Y17DRAFT_454781 [Xylariaceae sp. FL0594]|nr:hypothetical protein F5Y17DRAFT_454781 [Xylariaceae sp. FL0594]